MKQPLSIFYTVADLDLELRGGGCFVLLALQDFRPIPSERIEHKLCKNFRP